MLGRPAELQHSFLGEIRDATLIAGGDRSILTFTDRTLTFATGVRDVFASDASVVDSSTLVLVAQNASDSCETGAVGRYEFSLSPSAPIFFNGYHLAIAADDRQRFVLLDLGDGNTVAIQVDSRETADFDSFVAEAMPIVETFSFPPA